MSLHLYLTINMHEDQYFSPITFHAGQPSAMRNKKKPNNYQNAVSLICCCARLWQKENIYIKIPFIANRFTVSCLVKTDLKAKHLL